MGYLLSRKVPRDYWLQMQWQMSCTGRSWCDWVSFDDRVPETHQMLIIRVHRDDKMINDMKKSVIDFLAEVDRDVGIFNSMTVFTFDKEQA
jgi:predicted phage-related endonuclease